MTAGSECCDGKGGWSSVCVLSVMLVALVEPQHTSPCRAAQCTAQEFRDLREDTMAGAREEHRKSRYFLLIYTKTRGG